MIEKCNFLTHFITYMDLHTKHNYLIVLTSYSIVFVSTTFSFNYAYIFKLLILAQKKKHIIIAPTLTFHFFFVSKSIILGCAMTLQ